MIRVSGKENEHLLLRSISVYMWQRILGALTNMRYANVLRSCSINALALSSRHHPTKPKQRATYSVVCLSSNYTIAYIPILHNMSFDNTGKQRMNEQGT